MNSPVESRLWGSLCSGWLILVVSYGNGSFIISSIPKLKRGPYSIAEQWAHCDTPYSTDLSEAEQQIHIYNIRHSLLIVLAEISANWVSPTEISLEKQPLSLPRMLQQCINLCSAFHPPPCLNQGLFYPAQGSVGSANLWGVKQTIEAGQAGPALTQLCVCTDRYWFGGTDADSRARGWPAAPLPGDSAGNNFPCRKMGHLKGICVSNPSWGAGEQKPEYGHFFVLNVHKKGVFVTPGGLISLFCCLFGFFFSSHPLY